MFGADIYSRERLTTMEYLNVRTMEKSKGLQPFDSASVAVKPQENIAQVQGYNMSQDSDISAQENVILQTKNYDIFKFDPLNRPVRQDKLDRLYDSVKEKNLLHLFPIVVNRSLVVMDGQHRLRVAQALDTPIYYIVSSQMRIEDAAHVNINVTNWRGSDYLDYWCKIGLADYILLRDFMAANQFLTLSMAQKLCASGGAGNRKHNEGISHNFNSGQYRVNDISFAAKVAGMARDFSIWVRFWKDATFIGALTNLASNEDYDHKRMMAKMEYLSTRMVKCADLDSYLKLFEDIFNHKVRVGNEVRFIKQPTRRKRSGADEE